MAEDVEKKEEKKKQEKNPYEKKGDHMKDGIYISKRSLWLIAGSALGALAALGIGKASKKIKPAVVGAVKECYAFKEWVTGKYERAKEDIEDIVAEAKHAYYKDLEVTAEAIKKEKEILEQVEKAIEKMAKKEAE